MRDDDVFSRLPRRLVERLMDFQKDGVKFAVKKHGRCLVADEMGLGKTLQAISIAYYYRNEWPLLIIVPSSLRYCWIEELEKWLPGVHPHDINLIRGGNDASDISSSQITIVTYGLLSKQTSGIVREALTNQHFKVIICDESHYIKNSKTASSKAVVPLIKNASRRILLSGTPALSKPVELFPQIDAIKPGGFGSWWQFTARYCDAKMEWIGRQKMRKVDGASNLEELQSRLSSSIMIRREKKDVLTQLPPKQRQKVPFELKDSSQKKEILNLFEELKPMLRKGQSTASLSLEAATEISDDKNKESLHRLSLISKLYQLSGEAKIGPVKEYLEMLCDNKSLKFLVFAYHHVMMNGIQQTLWDKKVKFIRIDGETKPEDRLLYVQQFQSDSETRVAILSILAAGVGLTFTAAKLVVFAEMYWTPGVMVQCEDRAHRIGQTASLPVHYLVAKGTMDEWVWGAVCRKTVVTSAVLSGKKSSLEAGQADSYQVEVLSNADAWVPKEQTDMDFQTFFQSQKSNDQRSILEFFTPPSSKNKNLRNEPGHKRRCSDEDDRQDRKKQKISGKSMCEDVVILDSDEEEDLFKKKKKQQQGKNENLLNEKKLISAKDSCSPQRCLLSTPTQSKEEKAHRTPTSSGSVGDALFKRKSSESPGEVVSEDPSDVSGVDNRQWPCSVCTFLNHLDLIRCEMCNTPSKYRTRSPKSTSAHSDRVDKDDDNGSKRNMKSKSNEQQATKCVFLKQSKVIAEDSTSNSTVLSKKRTKRRSHSDAYDSYKCEIVTPYNEEFPLEKDDIEYQESQISTYFPKQDISGSAKKSNKRKSFMLSNEQLDCGLPGVNSIPSLQKQNTDRTIDLDGFVYISDDETTEVPRERNRKCFQLDSDSEEETLVKVQDRTDDVNRTPANASRSRNLSIQGETARNMSTPDCVSKARNRDETGPNIMSTPAGQDTNCFSTSWDILPCESPCFNLQLESSSDISHETMSSFGNDTDELRQISRSSSGSVHGYEAASGSVVNSDETLPVLIHPRKRCSQGEVTPRKEPNSPSPIHENRTASQIPQSPTKLCDTQQGVAMTPKGKESNTSFSKTPSSSIKKSSILNTSHGQSPVVASQTSFPSFQFCVSLYTGRVYLFDQDGDALSENFLPLDVEMGNMEQLPSVLHHHGNLRLVQKFVREWNSLTETKKRLIVKRGLVFSSPLVAYDEVRSGKMVSTQRHKTKEDVAGDAMRMAETLKGSVRTISRKGHDGQGSEGHLELTPPGKGVVQALTSDGVPLCLSCQQPYENTLLQKSTITNTSNAWNTRFCSAQCMDKYWIQTHSSYCRDKVYEVEHGICQLCTFNAHSFYKQIKNTVDLEKRAKLLSGSKFSQLKAKQKEGMVRKPVEGQFWHVDHIIPVWEGGGMCDIDNMRTLCVVCHQKVTAGQARKRAVVRRLQGAAAGADITAFFKKS